MKMNVKGQDDYQTPDFLYEHLDRQFRFTMDAACNSNNLKGNAGFQIDKGIDGLKASWAGQRIFCNPPFSNKSAWIKKAHDEILHGDCFICVMILPTLSMTIEAWHKYIHGKFFYQFSPSRYAFIDAGTGQPDYNNNSGTTVVYFMKPLPKQPAKKRGNA